MDSKLFLTYSKIEKILDTKHFDNDVKVYVLLPGFIEIAVTITTLPSF